MIASIVISISLGNAEEVSGRGGAAWRRESFSLRGQLVRVQRRGPQWDALVAIDMKRLP